MLVICGLGNPGKRYKNTRHNIGFELIDKISAKFSFEIIKKNKIEEIHKGKIKNYKCFLLKPLNYMNLSGYAVEELISFYKIPKKNLIVIHDDIDLKIGKIKVKLGGGNGGHNGLLSIDEKIGNKYNRLRIGIGHPGSKKLVNQYVLGEFNIDEKKLINKQIKLLTEHFHILLNNKEIFLSKINQLFRKLI